MTYDPMFYAGTARHYTVGRPPYSRELVATLAGAVRIDGTGRLLDAGCGPGVLTIELAPHFAEAVGLEPDAGMLREADRRANAAGVENIVWAQALAEDLAELALGEFRLVTFGQSFQWTDRERVAEAVYDLLEPGGGLACITHSVEGRPKPDGPGLPEIPHNELNALVDEYLGPVRRAGTGLRKDPPDRYEDALARTRFGGAEILYAPGRADVVRDVDGVVSGYLSMSWAAPHLFGERLDAFVADARRLLFERSPGGQFWDWPGDTFIVLARKPAS